MEPDSVLLTPPVLESICSNLTFEEAIKFRDAYKLPELNCTFLITYPYNQTVTLRGVNPTTIQIYQAIRKIGIDRAVSKAISQNNVELFKLLVGTGVNLDEILASPLTGETLLMRAAYLGRDEIVDILLNAGAQINLGDNDNSTALIYAMQGRQDSTALKLLEKGANFNFDFGVFSLLGWAIQQQLPKVVNYLLDQGVDPNTIVHGEPVLITAIAYSHGILEIITSLLNHGADPNLPGLIGFTPLIEAITTGQDNEVIDLLLKYGANINARDHDGQTALFYAIQRGDNSSTVEFLKERGAIQ